ncbi:iron dicitrate transport regulator FecR [Aliidiomarina taiwanensis]|uniref:Iron dicitrate transport regulator FecR n=1 Tax=Aliidiomarina taiwanensis TaxID=946228 RepID=A0A432WTI1_9GAMM|nr:FecR domain-containing protein [Aliidiomarina taiwanensis]RUO37085.1 iron dicitrate transport regulator FecR [Aliidiomarina taiwanensis]
MMNEETLQEQAAYYVTRLHSGEMNGQEERELERWRQQSDAHEAAFMSTLALWDLSNNLYPPAEQTPVTRVSRIRAWGLSVAAAVALSVVGVYFLSTEHASPMVEPSAVVEATPRVTDTSAETSRVTAQRLAAQSVREHRYLQTGLGEVDTVELSDGSVLTLNTETRIQIAFNQHERHVVLVAGEAFFDVASDANRPFVIDTGEQEIRVLGTKFNVRKEETGVRVAVLEGKVSVTRMSSLAAADVMDDAKLMVLAEDDYLLEAGAMGSFSATADVVAKASYELVNEAQNWRRGVFRFDDASLADVVAEFNRYRTQKIVLADPQTGELRISGVFHFSEGEGLLTALTASLPVVLDRTNDTVTIRKIK